MYLRVLAVIGQLFSLYERTIASRILEQNSTNGCIVGYTKFGKVSATT